MRKAKQKLKQIEAAEAAKTTDEDLLRYAYDVGTRFGVTAPDSWTPDSKLRCALSCLQDARYGFACTCTPPSVSSFPSHLNFALLFISSSLRSILALLIRSTTTVPYWDEHSCWSFNGASSTTSLARLIEVCCASLHTPPARAHTYIHIHTRASQCMNTS